MKKCQKLIDRYITLFQLGLMRLIRPLLGLSDPVSYNHKGIGIPSDFFSVIYFFKL